MINIIVQSCILIIIIISLYYKVLKSNNKLTEGCVEKEKH